MPKRTRARAGGSSARGADCHSSGMPAPAASATWAPPPDCGPPSGLLEMTSASSSTAAAFKGAPAAPVVSEPRRTAPRALAGLAAAAEPSTVAANVRLPAPVGRSAALAGSVRASITASWPQRGPATCASPCRTRGPGLAGRSAPCAGPGCSSSALASSAKAGHPRGEKLWMRALQPAAGLEPASAERGGLSSDGALRPPSAAAIRSSVLQRALNGVKLPTHTPRASQWSETRAVRAMRTACVSRITKLFVVCAAAVPVRNQHAKAGDEAQCHRPARESVERGRA
jgi:hypothetical protein